jgi:hypothetical protein
MQGKNGAIQLQLTMVRQDDLLVLDVPPAEFILPIAMRPEGAARILRPEQDYCFA